MIYQIWACRGTRNPEDIQRSYRKLARTYHPDVNRDPGAEGRFTEISEAYDVLSDPNMCRRSTTPLVMISLVCLRAWILQAWARASAVAGGAGARVGSPVQRAATQSALRGKSVHVGRREGTPTSRIFWAACSERIGMGRSGGRSAGADQEAEIEVTVEEAFSGARRSVPHRGRRWRAHHHRDDPRRGHRGQEDPAVGPGEVAGAAVAPPGRPLLRVWSMWHATTVTGSRVAICHVTGRGVPVGGGLGYQGGHRDARR